MATITVSSNPSTTGDTLTVNFTTDATNISDILLSKDGGSTYISATSFTNTKAVFNVSSWNNGTYNNCKLKCVYTETSSGGGEAPDNSWEVESPSNSFIVTTDFGGNTSPLMRNEKCTYTAGGMTMGTGSYSVIDKYMSCDLWRMEAEVEVLDKSSVFGFLTEPIINGVPTSGAQKGALMLFDSGYIRLYDHYTGYFKIPTTVRAQTPFTIETGKKYKIKGQKHGWIYTFTITDTTNSKNTALVTYTNDGKNSNDQYCGKGWGLPGVCCVSGSIKVHSFAYNLLCNPNPKAIIFGDSITEGTNLGGGTGTYDKWSSQVRDKYYNGNCLICGRGWSTTNDMMLRMKAIHELGIKPQENVIVLIGANDVRGSDEWLEGWKTDMKEKVVPYIKDTFGVDPVICCLTLCQTDTGDRVKKANAWILQQNWKSPRFDKATSANEDGTTYSSQYSTDGLHPNKLGSDRMFAFFKACMTNTEVELPGGGSTGGGEQPPTPTLTISNIANITKPEKTEFYIEYSTNRAVTKHEVSWDGGSTFYDKTTDVTASGTKYKFKHDNKASAGSYSMAIRVTDSDGNTKTSNVFTVTLTSTVTPSPDEPTLIYDLGSEKTFDGTSKYIDTMVKPFKTASDYTIFIDFDDGGDTQNDDLANVMHCVYEEGIYDGLKLYLNHEDGHYYLVGNSQNTTTNYTYEDSWTMVKGQRNKLAIAISKGVVSQIVINGSAVAVNKNTYDMNDYSLILGAYQDAQCNKSKYWKGTIHACKVWNSAFTVAQMKELCNSSSGGGSGSSDAYRPGRTLIWEDDFTGTTLNTANWDYENNYSRPNEVQNYVAGTNNVWVENSNLVIKAKKESSNGKEWSSGCIHTDNKQEFMYGRFEAKIKIPQTVGSFPAFWTLGGNYEEGGGITWPYCGEIDIMEHKQGYAWTTAGALYRTDLVWDNWDAKDLGRVDSGAIGNFDDYHIYAMEWTHDKLDYYVDDRLIGHSDISDDNTWFMFHQPHYILLNQALGAAGGSVPSNMTEYTMYVDWVRVYAPEAAPSGGGTTNKIWFEDTSARHMDKWSKLGLIPKFNESWTNKVITWKSNNESIATVCGGRVDSKGVDGSCIITATTLEGQSASITVNVGNGQPTTPTTTIGNMTYGKGIDQTTHIIKDDAACWATVDPVTVEQGATYTLQMDGTWVWGYAFDDSDNYVSELFTTTGNNNYVYTFTAPTNKIRYGCYDPGKYLTYCKLTKVSGGSSGGDDP